MRKWIMTVAIRKFTVSAVLFGGLMFMGCDRNDFQGEATVEGSVTDDAQYAKTDANIEGATVTAARVTAGGQTQAMSGQATTNAEGHFSLQTDATGDVVVLTASRADFQSQILVDGGLESGTVTRVGPMTGQSRTEAEVYVAARQQQDAQAVTPADVAAHISGSASARVRGGGETAANVATAIRSAVRAETGYLQSSAGGASSSQMNTAITMKRASYMELQANLYAATTASARQEAAEAFLRAMVDAYGEAGVDAMAQARARQAAVSSMLRHNIDSAARTQLRKRASILAAISSGMAVEDEFRARQASDAQIQAVVSARNQWLTSLRAATSAESINQANAAFYAAVRTQLAQLLEVNETAINLAADAISTARTTLDASLAAATTAELVVNAFTVFYAAADAAATASLAQNTSQTNAESGARIIVLLSIQAQAQN